MKYTVSAGKAAPLGATVDDDGAAQGQHTECRELNNRVVIPGVTCP